MFHAAHVALYAVATIEQGTVYKSHGGLIAAFSKELVRSGRVDDQLGRSLSKVHAVRLLADYAGDPPDQDTAAWAIEQAETFVTAAGAMSGA